MNDRLTEKQRALVEDNVRLAYSLAIKMDDVRLDEDDRKQAGLLGLVLAAQKYDEAAGVAFSTYSRRWIVGFILRAEAEDKTIWVPQYQRYGLKSKELAGSREKHGEKAKAAAVVSSYSGLGSDIAWHVGEPSTRLFAAERARAVQKAIASLADDEREMVEARCVAGETYKMIGDRFGMGRLAVSQRIKAVLDALSRHPAIQGM
jgi:RNA polymerase sigma factor (sigma-70 family)